MTSERAQSGAGAPDENTVLVVGGGVAGIAASCALADAGFRVTLVERRGYLGGRASSYFHPGTSETIDNCQHVLFGCCTNLIDLYQRLDVEDRIFWDSRMTLIEPGGRRSVLEPSWLPAPMHGLPGILRAQCFSVAYKAALVWAMGQMMLRQQRAGVSLLDWLKAHGQTEGALRRFWELVIASALNASLDAIEVTYAQKVIRELFLNSPQAGAMGMSRVPLSELYGGVEAYLEARRGGLLRGQSVSGAEWDADAQAWTLKSEGRDLRARFLVLALSFEAMAKLLPQMPEVEGRSALSERLSRLTHWPICSVHLWFDREITELDHAVLLDREIHWMYHKSRWQPMREREGSYVELVISANAEFAMRSREEAIRRAVEQLGEYFPAVKTARVVKSALVKEVRATFGVPPGIDDIRPDALSPWPQCFLAGDWVQTGWPATMEGAVRSGYLAAEALCRSVGDRRSIVVADLAPTGGMKLLG